MLVNLASKRDDSEVYVSLNWAYLMRMGDGAVSANTSPLGTLHGCGRPPVPASFLRKSWPIQLGILSRTAPSFVAGAMPGTSISRGKSETRPHPRGATIHSRAVQLQ